MGSNDRFVVKRDKGWAVEKSKGKRASAVTTTQAAAEKRAKEIVRNLGGGEVRVQNREGKWRDSDTVAPAKDPYPPKDKKH